jgi:hypothetical protein
LGGPTTQDALLVPNRSRFSLPRAGQSSNGMVDSSFAIGRARLGVDAEKANDDDAEWRKLVGRSLFTVDFYPLRVPLNVFVHNRFSMLLRNFVPSI